MREQPVEHGVKFRLAVAIGTVIAHRRLREVLRNCSAIPPYRWGHSTVNVGSAPGTLKPPLRSRPDFDEHGYLPPGIHPATLEEIEQRFGRESELRRVQMQSLHWLLDVAHRANVKRLIVNGSFVTDAIEPNDVDCLLLVDASFPSSTEEVEAEAELENGLPFLQIDLATQEEFDVMVSRVFGSDRLDVPKGMMEVTAWT